MDVKTSEVTLRVTPEKMKAVGNREFYFIAWSTIIRFKNTYLSMTKSMNDQFSTSIESAHIK